uniref:Uncharacterized protein n=1 Tax=Zea mays TaxID=4577 RepID=B7ZY06_MAIZE|nr:unknown [Zea mays]
MPTVRDVYLEVYIDGAVDAVVDGARVVGHHGRERLELGQLQVGVRRHLREETVHELGHHGDRRQRRRRRRALGYPEAAATLLCQRRRRVPGPDPVRGRHEVVQDPLHAVDVIERLDVVAEVGHEQVVQRRVLQLRADPPLQILPAQWAGVEEHRRAQHSQQELGGGHALLGRQQRHDLLQEVPLVALRRSGHAGGARGDVAAAHATAGAAAAVGAVAGQRVAEAGVALQPREEPPGVEHDGAGDALVAHALGLHRLDEALEHGQAEEGHVLVPPVHPGRRRRRGGGGRRVARPDAVPERVLVDAGVPDHWRGSVGAAGLGGQRRDAARDEVQVLGSGEHALAGLERLDGVLPVGEHVDEEALGLRDEVALGVVVRHAQVLGGAAEAHHVERVELDLDVVAELGRQLEGLGASGDVVQLQRAHAAAIRRSLVLADHPLQHAAPAQQRELRAYPREARRFTSDSEQAEISTREQCGTNLVEVKGHLSDFDNYITLELGRASPGKIMRSR